MSSRLDRFTNLRIHGLFLKEAQELSKNEYDDVPYFQEYLHDRQRILKEWKVRRSESRNQYLDMVYVWYESHGWVDKNNKIDVWKAWRHYEKKWKDQHDDYKKPAKKRRQDLMETERKLRRSLGY